MNEKSRIDQILTLAALAIVFVAPTQWSFRLGFGGDKGTMVTLVDLLVGITFMLWLANVVFVRHARRVHLPTPSCIALVLAGALSLIGLDKSAPRGESLKELVQLAEYFLIAFAVLTNCIPDRKALQSAIAVFATATGVVVLIALVQYSGDGSSFFDVRGSFGNRNVLSTYLALALPVLFGVALHHGGCSTRVGTIVTVFVGLAMILAGGPFMAVVLALAVMSALHGRLFFAAMLVLGFAGFWIGPMALRPHHGDAVVASVSPFVSNNRLLDSSGLLRRSGELLYGRTDVLDRFIEDMRGCSSSPEPLAMAAEELKGIHTADARRAALITLAEAVATDDSIPQAGRAYWDKELRVAEDCERYDDARLLLTFLRDEMDEGGSMLAGDELEQFQKWYKLCKDHTSRGLWQHPHFGRPVPARRYVGWQAALNAWRGAVNGKRPSQAMFGRGAGGYNRTIIKGESWQPVSKLSYDTDEPELFNVGTDEADTFGQVFVTLSEMGILGLACLAWVWLSALGKAARVWRATNDSFYRGLALGLIGSMAAFPLCALYSGILVRGVAVPFVFLIVCAELLRRFEFTFVPEQNGEERG